MSQPTSFLTGIYDQSALSGDLQVTQNYPNPFSDVTYIDVTPSQPGNIEFSVSDITGRIIYSRNYDNATRDLLRIKFENHDLADGIYYYTLRSKKSEFTGKMMVK